MEEKTQKLVEEIHRAVVKIEISHGEKLDALFDGQKSLGERMDGLDSRMDGLDSRMDRLDGRMGQLQVEAREIKGAVGLFHSVANDHESRLQNLEHLVREHIASHR